MVTEFIPGGEMYRFISNSGILSEQVVAHYMRQLLSAVSYCHKLRIIHRDLKLENMLLESQQPFSVLKIIDFGTAALIGCPSLKTFKGTSYYIAPESIIG